jgi:hypothetical protein
MKQLKKSIVCFCLLFVFTIVNAQIKPPQNNPEKLKGNVKSIEIIEYTAVEYFGELKKDTVYRTMSINLDINNNYLNWKKISKRKTEEIGEMTYTNEVNFKEIKRIRDNSEIDLSQWKYDSQGNIVEAYEYDGDSLTFKETATYNKSNKITEYKSYFKNGKLYWKKNWKYDLKNNLIEFVTISDDGYYDKETYKIENGKTIETISFDDKGNKVSRKKHYYHTSGKIKEVVEEFYDSDYFSKIISRYNINGKPSSEFGYDKNSDISYKKSYEYDLMNNLKFYEDHHSKDKYTYDSKGNVLTHDVHYKTSKRTHRNKKVTRVINSFEYDSVGNKIKEVTTFYLNDNLIEDGEKSVEERIITYR